MLETAHVWTSSFVLAITFTSSLRLFSSTSLLSILLAVVGLLIIDWGRSDLTVCHCDSMLLWLDSDPFLCLWILFKTLFMTIKFGFLLILIHYFLTNKLRKNYTWFLWSLKSFSSKIGLIPWTTCLTSSWTSWFPSIDLL